MPRALTLATAALSTFLTTVSLPMTAAAQSSAAAWQDEMPIRQPWLRDHLPDDALMYLRVPHLFGLFTTPKGNALDPALRSRANVQNVQKIRQGIIDNVLLHIPLYADLRVRMFEEHLRSPLEVTAFIAPAPAVLVVANLDLASNTEFEDMVAALALEMPGFGLQAPLDDRGLGTITGPGLPVHLQFDAATGRLLLHAGPAVTPESFAAMLTLLERDEPHRMRAMESRVDESGQGLFYWIDAEQALPAMKMFMQPEQYQQVTDLGLEKVSAAAFGYGVANGKGRLAVLADLPDDAERGFLPRINNRLSARSAGAPDGLMLLSVPSAAEFSRMEALALASAGDDARGDWDEFKNNFAEMAGMPLEDALGSIGPDLAFIFDSAGDYMALRLRDRRLWEQLVENLSEEAGSAPDSRRIDGDTYYHISVPNEFGMIDEQAAEEMGWAAVLMRRSRDHWYWVRDGDYLYIASTPQVLIDRAAMRARTDVGDWLQDTQRLHANDAIFAVSGTTEKLPMRLYSAYIEILQMLADIAKADIDVWSMPTPRQLGLAKDGALGFTLNFGEPTLAMEFTFESNPAEMFGSLGGAATVGILAAIAIPAYQDYTVRARVSEGLALGNAMKRAVEDFYLENGRFPNADEAAAMSNFTGSDTVESVTVEAGSGRVIVEFVVGVIPDGGRLELAPDPGADGLLEWSCESTIVDKHVPAACRGTPADEYGDEVL